MCHGLGNLWVEAREAEKKMAHITLHVSDQVHKAKEAAPRPGPGVCLQQIQITNGLDVVTSV